MDNINPNIDKTRLTKSTILAYGLGDLACNLCWSFIGSYLTIFYTDIIGMAPALAALVMVTARIFDAAWDPVFGVIADKTQTRYGKFRPYIIYGAPVLAIFSILSFIKVGSGTISYIICFISYFICGLLFTIVNLSYGSLSSVMSTNQDDIAQLNSWRSIGQNIGSIFISMATPTLLLVFSGTKKVPTAKGYLLVAIVYALMALPMLWWIAYKCHERIKPIKAESDIKISDTFKALAKNKPLLILFLIMLISMLAMFGRFGVLTYYVVYCIGNFKLIALFMTLPSLAGIVGIFLTRKLVTKVGRKKMVAFGYLGAGLSLICMFFVGIVTNYKAISTLLFLDTLYGIFYFVLPIPMAMVTDVVNYGEYTTGVRSTGITNAAISLAIKLGSAFGASILLAIMGMTGYVANKPQDASAILGINSTTNLICGLIWILAILPLAFYPLTEEVNEEINAKLTVMRENIDLTEDNLSKVANKKIKLGHQQTFVGMTTGTLYNLAEIKDPLTKKKMLGNGFAIDPSIEQIVSPTDGKIINIFTGKHALGIRTDNGLEYLLHFGIDTSILDGEPFEILVKIGDRVQAGQVIAQMDFEKLREQGKKSTVLLLITSAHLKKIEVESGRKIEVGQEIINWKY